MAKDHQFHISPVKGTSSHREGAEDYGGILYRDGSWRVAICRDGIQYLLQRQRPGKAAVGGGWDSIRFCVTRSALIRDWNALTGDMGLILLGLLPVRASMVGWRASAMTSRPVDAVGQV